MADGRDLARLTDPELELALRDTGRSLAWPGPTPAGPGERAADPAARARQRIVAQGIQPTRRTWWVRAPGRRPLRSSLVLAVAAILMLAAIAAAIGLGLPGIRITLDAPTSPSASTAAASSPSAAPSRSASARPTPDTGPLGSQLGLGAPVATADLRTAVTFPVRLPAAVGAPATAWLLDGRLSAVWPASPTLPPLEEPGLGLILTEFPGDVDAGYFEKVLDQGTTIEPVEVDGVVGYWISGRPHELIFVDPSGQPVFDSRRVVGESLIWARDGITYRLETGLDRAGAVKLANSLR